jgi:hypothetical protein
MVFDNVNQIRLGDNESRAKLPLLADEATPTQIAYDKQGKKPSSQY